jgi:hypothetical protein
VPDPGTNQSLFFKDESGQTPVKVTASTSSNLRSRNSSNHYIFYRIYLQDRVPRI